MPLIAKIAVSAATYAIDKPYDYLIPQSLRNKICPGPRWPLRSVCPAPPSKSLKCATATCRCLPI